MENTILENLEEEKDEYIKDLEEEKDKYIKILEEEKDKYIKNLDKDSKSFSSYINDTYTDDEIIFYENTINHLILYKLMKIYSAVPDMIINFFENKYLEFLDISFYLPKLDINNFNILQEDDVDVIKNQFKFYNILHDIKYKYVEKEYGKFIPSKKMLDNIIKYTQGEKICILGDDSNFLLYLLKNKGINNICKYKTNINNFDVLIIYDDKLNQSIFNNIKNKKNIKFILVHKFDKESNIMNKLYDLKVYENIIEFYNKSLLTYFNTLTFFLKDDIHSNNIKIKDNEQIKKIYDIYSYNLTYIKDIDYYNEIMELLLPLIEFKYNKDKKDTSKKILEYLTNIYYPKIEAIFKKNINDWEFLSTNLLYGYFDNEYSFSTPDFNIINEIVDFVGNMKILEIEANTGFWSYLFKSYGLNVISTKHKKDYICFKEKYCIDDWIYVENLSYDDAFKKYNDADVLFICWGDKNIKISGFKGKYIIIIGKKDDNLFNFHIKNSNKKYKLLKEIENNHITLYKHDYLFIYEKVDNI